MAKTSTKVSSYKTILQMNGVEYMGTGATLLDSLNSLGIDYTKVKTKGVLTVHKGDRNYSRVIQLPKLRRYFASKILMVGLIRDLETLLK
jgi:hypothetical protein